MIPSLFFVRLRTGETLVRLFYGEDGIDGGGFFDPAGIDGERFYLLRHRSCRHGAHERARWFSLGFVAGVEERSEVCVEAFGHLGGHRTGALERFGGCFGL